MVFTVSSISARNAKVISVSTQFRYSIIPMVPKKVSAQEIRLAKLEFIISETVSMSLVNRLIRSPDWWASKYRRGRDCRWLNRSRRIAATVFWEICTMIRA